MPPFCMSEVWTAQKGRDCPTCIYPNQSLEVSDLPEAAIIASSLAEAVTYQDYLPYTVRYGNHLQPVRR